MPGGQPGDGTALRHGASSHACLWMRTDEQSRPCIPTTTTHALARNGTFLTCARLAGPGVCGVLERPRHLERPAAGMISSHAVSTRRSTFYTIALDPAGALRLPLWARHILVLTRPQVEVFGSPPGPLPAFPPGAPDSTQLRVSFGLGPLAVAPVVLGESRDLEPKVFEVGEDRDARSGKPRCRPTWTA